MSLGWWWTHRPESSSRPSVAVLNLWETSEPPTSPWLSTALSEMLIGQLAAGRELRLVPGGTVARVQQELALDVARALPVDETLAQIGRILNTDFVVHGSYLVLDSPTDRQLRIDLRLSDVRSGGSGTAIERSGTEAQLFDLVSEVAAELRDTLGVKKLSFTQQRQVRATLPSSPDAFRLYLDGLEKLRSFDALGARVSLERAVAIDPSYSLAHTVLSQALSSLGHDREAEESGQRATELAEGLPDEDNLRIQGRYFEAAGEWPRAIQAYRSLWRLSPDSVDYGLRLTEAQVTAGRGEDALATVEVLRAFPAPANNDPRIDLAEAQAAHSLADYRRQLTASKRGADKGNELGASILVAEARFWQGKAYYPLLEIDEATAAFEEARDLFTAAGDRGRVAEVLSRIADVLSYSEDVSEALDLYQQALSIHRQTGNRKGVSQALNSMAFQFYQQGDLAAAREMLEEAVAIGRETGDRYSEANYLDTLIEVLLREGDLKAANELAQREHTIYRELGNREGSAWSYFYLGRIALAAGDVPKARNLHDQALVLSDEIADPYLTGFVINALARDLLAEGDVPGARRMSADSSAILRQQGLEATLATSQMTAAQILLENGRASEAEALSREAAAVFRANAWSDDETAATVLLARTLLAQDEPAEAEATLAGIRERAGASQNPTVRMSAAMAEAELHATAGRADDAMGILESVAEETHRLGLTQLELEARLAWGEIEVTSGRRSAARVDSGRRRLEGLAEKARELGCGLIARKAADTLAGSRNRAAAALPGIRDTEVW